MQSASDPGSIGAMPPGAAPQSSDIVAELRTAIAFLRSRAWVIGLAAGATLLCALAYLSVTPPLYSSTATILIAPPNTGDGPSAGVLSEASLPSSVVDTQVALLRSEAVARRVAEALRLDLDPAFNGALEDGPPLEPATHPRPERQPPWVVAAVLSRLDVRRDGVTSLLTITFRASTPDRAAEIANAVAREYVSLQLESRFDAAREANDWLNGRLETLRQELEEAENAVAALEARRGLYSVSGATLAQAQVAQLAQQLTTARAELAEREARLASARSQAERGADAEAIGEVLNSQAITQLRSQQAQVLRQRGELASTLGPLHPRLLQAEEELRQIDAQIRREVARILASIETEVEVSRRRVASLEQSLARWEGRLGEEGRSLVELRELERRAAAARTLYESFLETFNATGLAAGAAATDIRVVSPAEPRPWAVWPNPKLVLGFAGALGVLLGLGFAVLSEALRRGFGAAVEVERALGLPVVAMLENVSGPTLGAAPRLSLPLSANAIAPAASSRSVDEFVLNEPMASFAESLRALRNLFLSMSRAHGCPVIVLTSAAAGEGKTLTSISFGRVTAISGYRVLLIDADRRRCDLTSRLKLAPRADLTDVIDGRAPLEAALLPDPRSEAMVLGCRSDAEDAGRDVFLSEGFDRLIAEARTKFDVILIDTAPVTALAEVTTLACKADGVVLAVRWRKTPRALVEFAVKRLRRAGARFQGVLLTQVPGADLMHQGYYYAYRKDDSRR